SPFGGVCPRTAREMLTCTANGAEEGKMGEDSGSRVRGGAAMRGCDPGGSSRAAEARELAISRGDCGTQQKSAGSGERESLWRALSRCDQRGGNPFSS